MGQSWNWPGITAAFRVLAKPSLAIPHASVTDIRQVDFHGLRKDCGIRIIVFDKDNTLTAPYVDSLHPPFKKAWEECLEAFGPSNVLIVSNSAGTPDDKDHVSATRIEQALGVPVLRHSAKKPAGSNLIGPYFNCKPSEIAVVGDRVFTDIVYGNSCGALTILTEVVTEKGDNPLAVRIRRIERVLVNGLVWLGFRPLIHPLRENIKSFLKLYKLERL
ncbi:hypothetical protein HDU76_007579 [Blyttiomyces sp. JEL0837]|nr:hypothetical protein HDU76_007579 [Blyttiomyces sp. JEL0837]